MQALDSDLSSGCLDMSFFYDVFAIKPACLGFLFKALLVVEMSTFYE